MSGRRAVIYTRVSRDAQGHARSVADQERECRAMCEREGWTVATVLTDNDLGASRWSGVARPEYARLRETLRPDDVLVTWEASRAQRDLEAYVELRNLCAERGVLWAYSGRIYDLRTGEDRFGTGLDALFAERESEQTRERVLRSKRSSAAAGRPAGRLPFGYRKNHRTGDWEIDPEAAPIVREIGRRILAGDAIRRIAIDLNERGVPAPGGQRNAVEEWRAARIRVMFRSASYAGLRVHQGEVVGPGNWEPIVSEAEWHRIRAILDDPSRRTTPGPEARHLLTGIARCGVCGATVRHFNPVSIKTARYACSKLSACVGRRSDRVDELVTGVVLGRLAMPDARAVFTPADDSHSEAVDELRSLRARLDGFMDSAAEGELSPAGLARVEARLLPQIAAAEERVTAGAPPPLVDVVTADDVQKAWDLLNVSARREVVRALVDVTIHRSTAGTRQFNPDDIEIRWKS